MRYSLAALPRACALAYAAAAVAARPPAAPGASPVVFFHCDEMDGREVDPAHPDSRVTSKPNLDALAARGVNFVGAYCNNPLCAPSRASMFTGRRTSSIEAWSNVKPLMADVANASKPDPTCAAIVGYGPDACVALGRRQNVTSTINLAMADAGYDVRLYGKMDTGGGPLMNPPGTMATGFHSAGTWADSAGERLYFPGDLLHSWAQSANISKPVFARLDEPNDWIDATRAGAPEASPFPNDWESIDRCVSFLRDPASTREGAPPFFLYCSVVNPHPPYRSNATWEASVDRAELEASLARTRQTYAPPSRQHPADAFSSVAEGVPVEWNETTAHDMTLAYHGQIAEVDSMLGRVLGALEASGAAERTFVVFTSDHGEMHLEHRLVEKMSMYEGSARVPLIVAGPGVPRGVVRREFVSLIDLFPTFLDMARVASLPDAGLQGHSLAPLINLTQRRGPNPAPRPPHAVSEFAGDCVNAPKFMMRSGHMKLVVVGKQPPFVTDYPPQLFNITADPSEMADLAALPEYSDVLASMDATLRSVVDYPAVSRALLAENHANVARWMAALPDRWEHLLSQAYEGFDDGDLAKFKQWVSSAVGDGGDAAAAASGA